MANHVEPLTSDATRTILRRLRARARPVHWPIDLAVACGALGAAFLVAQTWMCARVIAAVIVRHATLAQEWPLLSVLPLLFVGRAILSMFADMLAAEAAGAAKEKLRAELHDRFALLRARAASGEGSGALAQLLVEGVDALDTYYAVYLPQTKLAALIPFAILVAAFPFDWVSGVIMLASAPLLPIFMIVVGRGAERLNQTQWRKLARLSAHLFDVVEGLTTLRLFDASRRQAAIIARISEEYRASTMAVLRVAFLSSMVLEFVTTLSIAMIAVYVGFRLYAGDLAFLPGLFVLLLAPEFYRPLRGMGAQHHARMDAIAAAERILPFLDAPEDTPDAAPEKMPDSAIEHVRFERVDYTTDDGEQVLRGATFSLRRGELVALTGASGAGKTTIARLALGLARASGGRILADDIDLAAIDEAAWFARVAWLPQAPTLFAGTIAENIRLARPDATDAELREAAAAAQARTFIERLPQGYDTVIGERGHGLSGGEIRRIALARCFLKQADLVVLDEPTAALDRETAARVTDAIARLARTRAVLMIAHGDEAAARADRVLVLAEGCVAPADRRDAA